MKTRIENNTPSVNPQQLFDLICKLAKNRDKKALNQILKEYGTLDVNQDNLTPIALLAQHGENDAVWFLAKNYCIHMNKAIYGAAIGENYELINQISNEYGGFPRYIGEYGNFASDEINGYARAKNYSKMDELINTNYTDSSAIKELAKMGDFANVDRLIELTVKGFTFPNGGSSRSFIYYQLKSAAYGAACGDYIQEMYNYIDQADEEHKEYPLEGAMQGAGASGNTDVIIELRNRGAYLENAIHSAASEGRIDIVEWILTAKDTKQRFRNILGDIKSFQDAILETAVRGAMEGGHYWIVKHLMQDYPNHLSKFQRMLFITAARGGHFEIINQLISTMTEKELDSYHGWKLLESIAECLHEGLASKNKDDMILRLSSLIDNKTLRSKICSEYYLFKIGYCHRIHRYTSRLEDKEKQDLIERSDRIHHLIKKFDFNFDQAQFVLDDAAKIWLSQGKRELVDVGRNLTEDVFYKISSYAFSKFNIFEGEIEQVNRKLQDFSFFKPQVSVRMNIENIEERKKIGHSLG